LLLMPSFKKKKNQCIVAHLFYFYLKFLASVFRLITPQTLLLMQSFNKKCSFGHHLGLILGCF
jgi:hypothetical protein